MTDPPPQRSTRSVSTMTCDTTRSMPQTFVALYQHHVMDLSQHRNEVNRREIVDLFGNVKFKQDSLLQFYLAVKAPHFNFLTAKSTTPFAILNTFKHIIFTEEFFDAENPAIIMPDACLEKVLKTSVIHVNAFRDLIFTHLTSSPDIDEGTSSIIAEPGSSSQFLTLPVAPVFSCFELPSHQGQFFETTRVKITDALRAVFRTLPGFNATQVSYLYKEVTSAMSAYIIKNKTTLFDYRNQFVCKCEGTLLGKAFGVKAFHRSQVSRLLRQQCTKVVYAVNIDTEEGDTFEDSPSAPAETIHID